LGRDVPPAPVKQFFLIALAVLALASAALYWTVPGKRTDIPVIYWNTQDDENKRAVVATFQQWIIDEKLPPVELRIDNTNQEPTKKLVQGLSGVGDDILDLYAYEVDLYPNTGMIADVTEEGRRLGFSPEATYPSLKPDIVFYGRQYGFPRNAGVNLNWVNRATFAKYGVPEPPWRWTMDEYEALGRKFVAAANPPGTRQRVFFANLVSRDVLRRGLGLANYNETGTRCTLDDPRNVRVLERVRRWVVEDHLLPSKEEDAAMSADISGFGSMFSHFTSGRFAMIYVGHWALIMLRPRGAFQLGAAEPVLDGFPNTEMGGGSVGVYAGSKHRAESVRFLQFLASEPFNRLIVRIADSEPPVPRYTETEEFLHPPGHENEWGVPALFAQAARETGITVSKSPFVLQSIVFRVEDELYQAMIAGRLTPAATAQAMADRINGEIALSVGRDPAMRKLYDERVRIQRQIEARRAAGQPVPAAWISDPFHLAYYRAHGWLEQEATP
jgi:multiple sugar transport system substrate-binding protein